MHYINDNTRYNDVALEQRTCM